MSVIHLPEREPAPAAAPGWKRRITERPACSCCGSSDQRAGVRAVTRADLSDTAAPWMTHLCAKCGRRLLRQTA
jgi:hypothetical protein